MKKGFFKRLKEYMYDSSVNIRDRSFMVFSVILILELIFVATPLGILQGEPLSSTMATCLGAILFGIYVLFAFNTRRIKNAKVVVSILVVFVFLPLMFFTNGGVYSGVPVNLLLGGIFINLIWDKKPLIVMNILYSVTMTVCWVVAYYHPELVTEFDRKGAFVDSLACVLVVNALVYIILAFHNKLYENENEIAREKSLELEEMNKAQNRFFSSMSHEIRTPINTVLGLNEIILRQEDASEEIRKDARNIQGAGKMLLALINDILDISKIEAGKMDIVPVNYNVGNLLSEVVNMIWLKAEEKGLQFNVDIDPNVPKDLFGDEVRIKQILINLLNNAVKYTQEGYVGLHMECEEADEKTVLLKIVVSDSGMGIKAESLPHLFDTFQRVDEEKNRYIEGTGLGLSIVKQLVELMEGEITVNSVYTQGSQFSVTLKQQMTSDARIGDMSITSAGTMGAYERFEHRFHAPTGKVLIVDDNEMNLQVEKKLLDGTELSVDLCLSGTEALDATLKNRYDVIFMDHLMPEMDGIECYEKIRKQNGGLNQRTPMIILTANAGAENIELYNNAGFDGYLVKPVSGRQLEDMLIKQLPGDKVIISDDSEMTGAQLKTAKGYEKKKAVTICASSMADIPRDILNELEIAINPFTVITDEGVFYDNTDIDSDELVRYMGDENRFVSSDSPSEEAFVEFFSRELKKSHHLIYITIASKISEEYNRATKVAKTFENVTVVNSSYVSSATGLLIMIAGKLAKQNMPPEKIVAELEEAKKLIHCSFVIKDTEVMARRGHISSLVNGILSTLWLRPVLITKNDTFTVGRFLFGNQRQSYEKYIRYALPKKVRPNKEIAFVTCVGMEEKDMVWIEEMIKNRVPFERIILKKASAGIATNCGAGTFGILYLDESDRNYNLASILRRNEPLPEVIEEEHAVCEEVPVPTETPQPTTKEWYEEIPMLDATIGMKNSGSKEAFLSVLKIYHDSYEIKANELEGFFANKDWENYTIKIHALKSSSRLVGAMDLGTRAEALEMAGKGNDISFIEENHEEAMKEFKEIRDALAKEFGSSDDLPPISEDKLEEAYGAITEFAGMMDYDCVKMVLDSLDEYTLPTEDKGRFDKVKQLLAEMNWDGIKEEMGGR